MPESRSARLGHAALDEAGERSMRQPVRSFRRAFTLIEMLLVIGLLAALTAFVLPPVLRDIKDARLPESAKQIRSLVRLTRARAMYDGKRYRLRFLEEGEEEQIEDVRVDPRQPLIEREDDPIREPGVFNPVKASWAHNDVLLDGIRCIEIRLGKPTLEKLVEEDTDEQERLVEELGDDVDEIRPPLYFEPDGTTEWCVFVVTNAPEDAGELEEDIVEEYPVIEIIVDGLTGLAWLQRPFYEEEINMLEENNWPPVLRRDFLDPRALTEDDVIEIQESLIRR
jgi:prepilin-type N-terminal cleavage/methylation domain-containing protein